MINELTHNSFWQLFQQEKKKNSYEQLESFVRQNIDNSSRRDLTIMIDHFSIDFIREFEDRFHWYSWPSPDHIKKNDRYKEFWWKYDV